MWRYCRAHILEMKVFIMALRNRLAKVNQTHYDRPLEFGIIVVGYAKNSVERLSAHKGHRNSNYIVNLMKVLSTCQPTPVTDRAKRSTQHTTQTPQRSHFVETGIK